MTHPPPDPPAPLELSTAHQLTSLAEVSRALVDVAGAEKGVEGELEALLAARAGLERDLARLAERTSEVRERGRSPENRLFREPLSGGGHPPQRALHPMLINFRGWGWGGAGWKAPWPGGPSPTRLGRAGVGGRSRRRAGHWPCAHPFASPDVRRAASQTRARVVVQAWAGRDVRHVPALAPRRLARARPCLFFDPPGLFFSRAHRRRRHLPPNFFSLPHPTTAPAQPQGRRPGPGHQHRFHGVPV
jgi:hypothetical protein